MALVGLLALLAGCAPPGPRALLEGKRLLEQGKYPQAVEKLSLATSMLTNNAPAWNYLGLAHQYAGQDALAEKAYQRALALNRDLSEVHYNLGSLWLAQNRFEAAKSELTTYTLHGNRSVAAWLKLGSAQLHCREPAAAEKSFTEALRLSPQDAEALNGMGLARLQRNRPTEAAECFTSALKHQPKYRPALLNLAIVYQVYLKDKPSALRTYRQYLALQPAPPNLEAVAATARLLEQELNPPPRPIVAPPAAQTVSNVSVVRIAPTNVPQFANVARPATAPTNVARPLAPTNAPKPSPVTSIARPPLVTNAPKPVVAASTSAPAPASKVELVKLPPEPLIKSAQDVPVTSPPHLEPPTPQAQVTTSSVPTRVAEAKSSKRGLLQRMNPINLFRGEQKTTSHPTALPSSAATPQPPPAKPPSTESEPTTNASPPAKPIPRYAYKSPAKPAPGNRAAAQGEFARGVEAQKNHELGEAIQAFQSSLQLDPSYFEAYYNLGLAQIEANNLSAALSAFETALAARPDSLDARYNFAVALKQANYPADAAHELEKILVVQPTEVRAQLSLALIYAQQLHEPAKARQHFMRVLELDPHHSQASAIRYWLTTNP